jgi:3-hydroxyisobutyrate dehydrogenase
MAEVAVLGTGIMGAGIARNLARGGHAVRVWNRTRSKAEPLAADGARVCDTPSQAAEGADVLVTMLADGPAVEAVAPEALSEGIVWVQTSTVGVAATDRLAHLAADAGAVFVDAPVLGSKAAAEAGELTVLGSGPAGAEEQCRPVFDAIARKWLWVGDAGAGTKLKLIANAWVLTTVANVAETIALAEALGIDPRRFLEAVEGAPFDMPYLHAKAALILSRDFTAQFPLELAVKDLRLALEAAGSDVRLGTVRAALAEMERAVELGYGREDSAATWFAAAGAT